MTRTKKHHVLRHFSSSSFYLLFALFASFSSRGHPDGEDEKVRIKLNSTQGKIGINKHDFFLLHRREYNKPLDPLQEYSMSKVCLTKIFLRKKLTYFTACSTAGIQLAARRRRSLQLPYAESGFKGSVV
jgi:hypothetical protein